MTVSELIRTKRAVRQFTDEPLSEEAIRLILNAGRRAQSSKTRCYDTSQFLLEG